MEGQENTKKSAVVLLSGGLDSATVAAFLQQEGYEVLALTIDYGQRHRAELAAAAKVAQHLGIQEHRVMRLDLRAFGGSALTDDLEVPKSAATRDAVASDIPITYVPARNTIFLSLALGFAEARGAHTLGIGVNAVDYSGYPDCRPDFVAKFAELANLATREGVEGRPITLATPLLHRSKVDILRLAYELQVPVASTLSCYDPRSEGEPCGLCDACRLRLQAEEEFFRQVEVDCQASAERVWPLRHRNLRQGKPLETAKYGEVEHLPTTLHLVLSVGGLDVGCATLLAEERAGGFGLRMRGVAIDAPFRGRGLGKRLLQEAQRIAAARGTGLWCQARVSAIPVYQSCGFERVGEEFSIPDIGPHYVMQWLP